jgi:acyl-CoA dehydrogenase
MQDHAPASPFIAAEVIARTVAGPQADDVDRLARFPAESFAACRSGRLLSMLVPVELGGGGATIMDVASVCSSLGRQCASTGLIFAMHQIQVASLINAGLNSAWHRDLLARISRDQLLLASATTEGGIGGDIRSSSCAVVTKGERIDIEKQGTVISYGRVADVILLTARRTPDSPASDQVLVALEKKDYRLEQTAEWDPLGMRGTCSESFYLKADALAAQVLPKSFSEIASQSMLATSHIFWSGVWHGIAADALGKAQSFIRARARQNPGAPLPGTRRLAQAAESLQLMRAAIVDASDLYAKAHATEDGTSATAFAIGMNNHKVTCSELTLEIVHNAMLICGISGYRNDNAHSLGRNLRDAYSAQVMINNDRIESNVASLLMVSKLDGTLQT